MALHSATADDGENITIADGMFDYRYVL